MRATIVLVVALAAVAGAQIPAKPLPNAGFKSVRAEAARANIDCVATLGERTPIELRRGESENHVAFNADATKDIFIDVYFNRVSRGALLQITQNNRQSMPQTSARLNVDFDKTPEPPALELLAINADDSGNISGPLVRVRCSLRR
jgi:hypothetical protein